MASVQSHPSARLQRCGPLPGRRSVALFHMDEYEAAKAALEQGQRLDPDNKQYKTWLRKCEAELSDEIGGAVPAEAPPAPPAKAQASPAPSSAAAAESKPVTPAAAPEFEGKYR